jgi:ribosome recycling factor
LWSSAFHRPHPEDGDRRFLQNAGLRDITQKTSCVYCMHEPLEHHFSPHPRLFIHIYIINFVILFQITGSIETLPVSLEGKEYELQELAQIVRKNPKTIVINMSSFPQAIPAALQSISKSGMNLNPQQDGTTLFIPVPK